MWREEHAKRSMRKRGSHLLNKEVKTITEGEEVRGTHKLESAEGGVDQDSESNWASEALTSWRPQTHEQVTTAKEGVGTKHSLPGGRRGKTKSGVRKTKKARRIPTL